MVLGHVQTNSSKVVLSRAELRGVLILILFLLVTEKLCLALLDSTCLATLIGLTLT